MMPLLWEVRKVNWVFNELFFQTVTVESRVYFTRKRKALIKHSRNRDRVIHNYDIKHFYESVEWYGSAKFWVYLHCYGSVLLMF